MVGESVVTTVRKRSLINISDKTAVLALTSWGGMAYCAGTAKVYTKENNTRLVGINE